MINEYGNNTGICHDATFLERQKDLFKRIDKVRNKISQIPNDKKILVFTDKMQAYYLFKYAGLSKKSIKGFLDINVNEFICSDFDEGLKIYDVFYLSKEAFEDVDIILGTYMRGNIPYEDDIRSLGYKGKIMSIYDDNDDVAMFCVRGQVEEKDKMRISNVAKQVINMINPAAANYYFESNDSQNANGKLDISKYGYSKYGINYADVTQEMESKCDYYTRTSDNYITYNLLDDKSINGPMLRRKSEKEIIDEKNYKGANEKTTIIVYGPIVYDNDYLYLTLKQYRMIFPESNMILATWESEKEKEEFKQFENLGISMVFCDKHDVVDDWNTISRIELARAALEKAKELGIEYSLVMGSECRVYAEDSISYVNALTKRYLVKNSTKERITILSKLFDNPKKFFSFPMYGPNEELIKLWKNVADGEELLDIYLKNKEGWKENIKDKKTDYWKLICESFIVVDSSTYEFIVNDVLGIENDNCAKDTIFNATDWFYQQT